MTPPPDAAARLERRLEPWLATPLRTAVVERLLAAGDPDATTLPAEISVDEVLAWLRVLVLEHPTAERLLAALEAGGVAPAPGRRGGPPALPARALYCVAAHAVLAWRAIKHDLGRPMIAVDAGRAHHDLVTGMRDLPKTPAPQPATIIEGRAELLAPGKRAVQLRLPLDGPEGFHRATVEALRAWRGWAGVRHWVALQRLFSVEGGRSGAVRWALDAHLAALGYAERSRRDPAVRARVAREVLLLTRLELALYAPTGRLRGVQPLLSVTTKYEALHRDVWALEGMELRLNEALYRGVRDATTGALGTEWYPAPIELAQIDHVRLPYAIVLGLILPMRWRWDLDTRDHCALSGANLLTTAGIKHSRHDPQRTWTALRRNLEELQRRGGLGRYEWAGEPWTLAAVCRLYPPQWARDRTVHGLRPRELPPPAPVMTGSELRAWRKAKGWTQAAAAAALGVSVPTIKRAEAAPDAPLGPALCGALALPPSLEAEGIKNRQTPRRKGSKTGRPRGERDQKPADPAGACRLTTVNI